MYPSTFDMMPSTFRVFHSYEEDSNNTLVRISAHLMGELGINDGDVLSITGERKTFATCLPLDPAKEPLESDPSLIYLDESSKNVPIIRISTLVHSNARPGMYNKVDVAKAETVEADKLVLGTFTSIFPDADRDVVLSKLHGMVVCKGDFVHVIHSDPHHSIHFFVVDADPVADAYIITKNTRFDVNNYIPAQQTQEPKLDRIVRVIAVGKQVRNSNFVLTLPSLEIFDDVSIISLYIKSSVGSGKERMYSHPSPSIRVYDDLGNSYNARPHGGGSFGGFVWRQWDSFEDYEPKYKEHFIVTPALDPSAKELNVVIDQMIWHIHEPPPPPPTVPQKISENEPAVGFLTPVKEKIAIASGPWEFRIPLT